MKKLIEHDSLKLFVQNNVHTSFEFYRPINKIVASQILTDSQINKTLERRRKELEIKRQNKSSKE